MKNKQKLWRRAAERVGAGMKRRGIHQKGARYGRAINAANKAMRQIKATPSVLFQRMALAAGIIQGELA